MRATGLLRQYFKEWPWPTKLPLKKEWFPHLSRTESIAGESKKVYSTGDFAVVGVLTYCFWRVYNDWASGAHQSRLCHLTGQPPAIIAQEFSFDDATKNRKVERRDLDAFRNEFAAARIERRDVESFIFKF